MRAIQQSPEMAGGCLPRGGRDVQYPTPLCLHFAAGKTESEIRGIDSKETGYFSEHLFPVPPPAWHRAGATGQWEGPRQAQAKPLSAPGRPLPTPPRALLPAVLPVLGTAQGLRNSPLQRVGLPAATPAPPPVPQPPQAWHWPLPSTFSRPVHLQASAAQRALISSPSPDGSRDSSGSARAFGFTARLAGLARGWTEKINHHPSSADRPVSESVGAPAPAHARRCL
ncbi:wiskott-Aldrich syndrome protein family member 1-like [Balaenoptera musculus]|uniref:Wiskott-Aldrich syndrome protein family member 1-like n=1 Tax=Balaenoptera musculus TaxID=9771 RepID=A0A8B8YUX3_BALMU|nr:wiskott-Aldrich syndrome protein family member 1-like [Balaenoptera musculus]